MVVSLLLTYWYGSFNSLTHGRGSNNFDIITSELIFSNWYFEKFLWNCSLEDAKHKIHDESTLVQIMAWCHQATRHYLSQCWPRSLSPYGSTRPQWVNLIHQSYFNGTRFIIKKIWVNWSLLNHLIVKLGYPQCFSNGNTTLLPLMWVLSV